MNTINKTELKINLSTYYILPLLKLNKSSWGIDNFIKSQVTKYGEVVVFIKNSVVAGDYYNHENYGADVDEEDGSIMIIYNIPKRFLEDYQMFLESKYSKMSVFAKDSIKAHAKANELKYNIPTGQKVDIDINGKTKSVDVVDSDVKLLALDLHQVLREKMEKELDIKLPKGCELISKLEDSEYININ